MGNYEKAWEISDGYKSPIESIFEDVQMQYENAVIKAVQKCNIKVDKNELLKALAYDRKQYQKGEWDMFRLITSAWHGKDFYFLQDNGTVYSRQSCTYLPNKEEAYKEFLTMIGEYE